MDEKPKGIFQRRLSVKLTEAEFIEKATELAETDFQIDAVESEKKAATESFKNKIGGLLARKTDLRFTVRNKSEMRDVDCKWFPDWASKSMICRRLDTQEAIDVRAMTPDELQGSFEETPDGLRLPEERDDSIETDGEETE